MDEFDDMLDIYTHSSWVSFSRTKISTFFKDFVQCDGLDEPVVVKLCLSYLQSPKRFDILNWCDNHLFHDFSHAFLGAIESDNGEWLLHMVPDSAPSGWFFAFGNYDDAIVFLLTWTGEKPTYF